MKLFYFGKDGGPESTVWGFWPVEIKSLFSIAFLKFVGQSREAFHNHAFNSISWVIKGSLFEKPLDGDGIYHYPSIVPIFTKKDTFHKVNSLGTTWVFTLRGPWSDTWKEFLPNEGRWLTLTHGRQEVK